MLQWINGHGFVTADQAAVWMGVCDRVGRRRLQRLVEGGYLQKKRFEFNDPQFHCPPNGSKPPALSRFASAKILCLPNREVRRRR
ncbi:MAG: hypothetical protein OEU92_17475, partial [Alphaproteobacteria bacterium]|nr:hypothetical protein [Alphaproteobacteria bacterium]